MKYLKDCFVCGKYELHKKNKHCINCSHDKRVKTEGTVATIIIIAATLITILFVILHTPTV